MEDIVIVKKGVIPKNYQSPLMKELYKRITTKLKFVINHNPHKKVVLITQGPFNLRHAIKYEDDVILCISCDSIEYGVLEWYFDTKTNEHAHMVSPELKQYIKKNI